MPTIFRFGLLLLLLALGLCLIALPPAGKVLVAVVCVSTVGWSACSQLLELLFPGQVGRVQSNLELNPTRCALMGWLAIVCQILLISWLPRELAVLLGLAFLTLDLFLGLVGGSALTRIWEARQSLSPRSWRTSLMAHSLFSATLLFPIVGWGVALFAGVTALGASLCRT